MLCFLLSFSATQAATPLPGPADIDRVVPTHRSGPNFWDDGELISSKGIAIETAEAPEGAEDIVFKLENIKVEGSTAFTEKELAEVYRQYLGKNQKLSVVWEISAKITELYKDKGYFLSRTYVPAQEAEDGVITLRVIEGYIEDIEVQGEFADSHVVQGLFANIKKKRPINVNYLETSLLLLNDLPGISVRAVIAASENKGAGVKMVLVPAKISEKGITISFDNYGSKFLGPYQAMASYRGNLVGLQETSLTALGAQAGELKYVSMQHKIPISARTFVELYGAYTKAHPGHTLKINDIESDATSIGVTVRHYIMRQRDMNMEAKLSLDSRNSNTDIIGIPLTRDRIRTIRPAWTFDFYDRFNGYNYFGGTLSKGLDILGATPSGDLLISRLNAKPTFLKYDGYYTRLQKLSDNMTATLSFAGQYSRDSLHSSEEFSYGGATFGKAYDSSELSGDSGVNASLDISYNLDYFSEYYLRPYVFYDVGKIWNNNADQPDAVSASSAGIGLKAGSIEGIGVDLAIAQPLTADISEPIYNGPKNPRYMFKISYGF